MDKKDTDTQQSTTARLIKGFQKSRGSNVSGKRVGSLESKKKIHADDEFRNPMEVTRLILDYANDAIYITQDGFFKFVNTKMVKITGFTRNEILKTPAIDFIHPDDRKVIAERYYRRFKGENVPNLYPHRIIDKKGEVHWVEVSTVMITWEGHPAQLSFMRDITERKETEAALKKSERLWADIINFLPDPTFAVDVEGRVTAWNQAIQKLTGIHPQAILGKGRYEYSLALYGKRRPILIDKALNPTLPIAKLQYLSFTSERDFLQAETELLYRGKKITLWCKAGLMKDGEGTIIGAIESIRDITALKEMNSALDALLKKRENDLRKNEEKFMLNIRELVLPYVVKLKSANLDLSHSVDVEIIEKHLNEIVSPFLSKLSSKYSNFSRREVQVASLIRNGMTTKEIAGVLNVSSNAVDIYRLNIRKKLGLNKAKINLRSFLQSLN